MSWCRAIWRAPPASTLEMCPGWDPQSGQFRFQEESRSSMPMRLVRQSGIEAQMRLCRPWVVVLLLVGGCFPGTEPEFGGMPLHDVTLEGDLGLGARAVHEGDSLNVVLTIQNTGPSEGVLSMGPCSFAVRGVQPGGRTWDNRLTNQTCPSVGIFIPIPPDQSREWVVWRFGGGSGWPLPPSGVYQVKVYYRLSGSAGLKELPAGTVRIP